MSLRVLITNHALAERAGTELYVRDLAEGLIRRGHTPIAYSTQLGEVAAKLRKATVPVVDNLASLSVAPDLIHGQHHIETMTALLHFAGVPAIYFCHGWLPWEEAPPRFPRIRRFVAHRIRGCCDSSEGNVSPGEIARDRCVRSIILRCRNHFLCQITACVVRERRGLGAAWRRLYYLNWKAIYGMPLRHDRTLLWQPGCFHA